jgi:hypothetical protein
MIKIAIGLITISIAAIVFGAIGRITVRVIDPENKHPDFEQRALAACMGVLALAMFAMCVSCMWLLGSVVMRVLAG